MEWPFFPPSSQSDASAAQRVMSSPYFANSADQPETSNNNLGNVTGPLGTLLGYIGAEAATIRVFECLLWPQRSFSNFCLSQTPWRALLTPMSGPMHKAALKAFDVMFRHDLFNGPNHGHMLGTAFFPELNWKYTMHGQGIDETHTEPVRNCLWARAMSLLPMLEPKQKKRLKQQDEEMALKRPHSQGDIVRARFRVNHLTMTKATGKDKENVRTFIHESPKSTELRTVMAIFASELTAVLVAISAAIWLRTPWALIWITPLALRLASASLAIEREGLTPLTSSVDAASPPCHFEVHSPETQPNFLLMTGPPAIILQFVRHYGHPKRNRFRELVQLAIVVAFGGLFPLELVCSTVFMSKPLQQLWLSYQLYCVLAMHVTRYSNCGSNSDTASALAQALSKEDLTYDDETSSERCILFGHSRCGDETLKVSLKSTYHRRYKAGKEALDCLVGRPHLSPSRMSSDSDITLAETDMRDETVKED